VFGEQKERVGIERKGKMWGVYVSVHACVSSWFYPKWLGTWSLDQVVGFHTFLFLK
jgi:hypothetical protein